MSDLPGEQIVEQHQALHSVAKTAAGVFNWTHDNPHPFLSIQGALFCLAPDQLAAAKEASLDDLLQQYSASHPVRELTP